MPDLTGQILGKYRIVRMLGSGGMGTVYLAEQATFQRTVALKVVTSENLRSPDAVRRFRREIQAAARLDHPNIVAAYDADEVDGVCFLVMEYVEGRDLRGLVAEGGVLPVAQAVDYTRQAAAGLAYAHARGIIHRDIKPANLLLGPGGTVKILDMGLALVLSSDYHDSDAPAVSELTQIGAVMGTVDYMSPEQALDTHATDARGDVYSLGCTLYFLLTGRAPYRGSTLMVRMLAHREGAIPSLAAARADVSPELDAVFRRMIAKAPADRFQTMDDLLAALRQVASPPAGSQRVPISVPTLNGGSLSQAETAGPGTAPSIGADLTAAEPLKLHSRRHQQKMNPAVIAAAAGLVSALAIGGYFLMSRSPKGRPTTKVAAAPEPRPAKTRAAPAVEPEDTSDRPIAEWVMQAGGSIELRLGEGTFTPKSVADLPLAPFRLTRVTVNGHRYAAGDLERLADLPELTHLELSGNWQGRALVSDSDLKFVQRLPRLESIALNFLTISDGALAHLAKLDRLTSVSLYHTAGIGDDGVAHLRGLHRLHSLHLGGTSVTDAVFEFLEEMPDLENLLLDDTRITGTGMTHLLPAKKLHWIHLANSQFNDAGLAALAKITWLPTLSIPNTQVTDAGLKSLSALDRLETLDIAIMLQITDAGIGHLAELKELRRLNLTGDGVTDAGVAALQARLPDCRIER